MKDDVLINKFSDLSEANRYNAIDYYIQNKNYKAVEDLIVNVNLTDKFYTKGQRHSLIRIYKADLCILKKEYDKALLLYGDIWKKDKNVDFYC